MAGATRQIAEFVCGTSAEVLPPAVIRMAELSLLDWLGSAVSGSRSQPTRALMEIVKAMERVGEATLIPDGTRAPAYWAALVNAASSHVTEMDDLHKPSVVHPGAPVIPAALAIAEKTGAAGRDLMAAIAVGYEVAIRVGECVGPTHYHYWHSTGTCGIFGAAAAVARLLGLSAEATVWALGSAGTQAAGLWEFLVDGAMSKQLHPAKAAADGLLAALMAAQGFTGATRIFEGEKGFCEATSEAPDYRRLTDGLGANYRILGNSFKAHAACYHIHSTIDAVLQLRAEHPLSPEVISGVTVRLYPVALDLLEKVEPDSPYAAKFNIPFCVAAALSWGKVDPDAFSSEALGHPQMRRLMKIVRLERDSALSAEYPDKWPAHVTIETRRGERYAAHCEVPKGDPRNPMTEEELTAKFRDLAAPILPTASIPPLIERCLGLHKTPTVRGFLAGLDPKQNSK
ncbi:MAG: MmgE/PrpD family protein [Candidatus Methylomirabilales bacterium]